MAAENIFAANYSAKGVYQSAIDALRHCNLHRRAADYGTAVPGTGAVHHSKSFRGSGQTCRWKIGSTAQPAYGFPGTPTACYRLRRPEFIFGMSHIPHRLR
jgi:hypothetical protein